MDNIARDAMLAKQAGMSYGQWKALQPVVKVEKKIPEGWKICECCGKAYKPHQKIQRFCDLGCRSEAYKPKANAKYADYYKRVGKEKRKEKKNEDESST